jgi:hypothetical protein
MANDTKYGILIRNGVNYSHDAADSITYDNTTSELEATNTQDALDELKSIIDSGTGGGHTILDDTGTALTQRDKLQMAGVYTADDSTNQKTVVNIARTMTEAQRRALPAAEQKGFIYTTDNPDYVPLDGDSIAYKNGLSITEAIDGLAVTDTFDVLAENWVGNEDPETAEDYPYIMEIETDVFNDNARPIWQMNGTGTVPVGDEITDIAMVSEAWFDSNGVILYATDQPTNDLVLEVKGVL